MIKRTGNVKLIDIGSAFEIKDPGPKRGCTPPYAAPEVLAGEIATPHSDLASLGYSLIEMLAGAHPCHGIYKPEELRAAKLKLPERLPEVLPEDVVCNKLLMNFIQRLIAPDLADPLSERRSRRRSGRWRGHVPAPAYPRRPGQRVR